MGSPLSEHQHQEHQTNEDEDPSLSLAALCISFCLNGFKFRPDFTHQCFEGEWIRGYQPTPEAMALIKDAVTPPHSSHSRMEDSSRCLSVQVELSPSCRASHVTVNISKKKREICTTRPHSAKRPRIIMRNGDDDRNSGDVTTEWSSSSSPQQTETSDSSFRDEEENSSGSASENEDKEGPTRTRRMPKDEIIERLNKGLPTGACDNKENSRSKDYMAKPLGTVVKEYQRKVNGGSTDFVLCIANGQDEGVAEYHNQVQKLALWFIETADGVNVAEIKGGGYWKVLYLFMRSSDNNKYALAGYITLFHFLSPFKKPKSGTVVRICQVLVLPPYQRAGHGKIMLKEVHDYCAASDCDIVELNVEDPAPGFTALRNRVDYELLQRACKGGDKAWIPLLSDIAKNGIQSESFFQPLSEADAIEAAAVAKITTRQVQIALEIYKLDLLEQACAKNPLNHLDCHTKYRLMVKKRLLKVHREDLGAYKTKQEQKDYLTKQCDDTLEQYRAVLKIQK